MDLAEYLDLTKTENIYLTSQAIFSSKHWIESVISVETLKMSQIKTQTFFTKKKYFPPFPPGSQKCLAYKI